MSDQIDLEASIKSMSYQLDLLMAMMDKMLESRLADPERLGEWAIEDLDGKVTIRLQFSNQPDEPYRAWRFSAVGRLVESYSLEVGKVLKGEGPVVTYPLKLEDLRWFFITASTAVRSLRFVDQAGYLVS